MTRRRTRHEWRDIIEDYKQSGLSAINFAASRSINIHTLRYWIHTQSVVAEMSQSSFVESQMPQPLHASPLAVSLPNDIRIEVPPDANCQFVRDLIDALL